MKEKCLPRLGDLIRNRGGEGRGFICHCSILLVLYDFLTVRKCIFLFLYSSFLFCKLRRFRLLKRNQSHIVTLPPFPSLSSISISLQKELFPNKARYFPICLVFTFIIIDHARLLEAHYVSVLTDYVRYSYIH